MSEMVGYLSENNYKGCKVKHWIDTESESNNVIAVSDNAIFIGSCDKEAYEKVEQQLLNHDSPVEVLGTDDLTTVPFSQIQNITSRSTDKDVDISYKAKKDISEKTIYFDSLEKKQDFIASIDNYIPEHLEKRESQQSAVAAAISPLISLLLGFSTIYLFIDKFRWPAVVIGGLWVIVSFYMLVSRVKEPPTITRWSISGRYFRKAWAGIKTGFSYAILVLIIIGAYGKFPDSYGPNSIYEQLMDDSLESSEIATLLDRGGDINYKDKEGDTALSIALSWEQDELAIALIESGADLSIRSNDELPLQYAIYNNSNIKVIDTMLKNGASLDFKIEGITPVEYSRQNENAELAKLISQYVNVL